MNQATRRVTLLICCILLLLAGCSRAPDALMDRQVGIGTHALYLYCQGTGVPTVVIDTGSGETYESWLPLIATLAQEARVCAYDRAGYGQSEPGPLPRDAGREADELRLLLEKAGVKAPYLLVGHSLGGLNAQIFAAKYPELLAGVVLIDPTPLGWLTGDAFPELRAMFLEQAQGLRLQAEAMRGSPDPKVRASADFYAMLASEMAEMPAATAGQLARIESFGDMPLTVIASTLPNPQFGASAEAFQRYWIAQSGELAAKSARGVFIRAEGSSHHVHLDMPEIVAGAVRTFIRHDGLTAEQAATLASLRKVNEYPLYTMRYYGSLPGMTPDSQPPAQPGAIPAVAPRAAWACSLFAALGDADNRLFGRNFDWRFSPALLLWTEPPDGYASVSMVDLEYFGVTDRTSGRVLADPVDLPIAERRRLLETPAMPFDGMNAAGVAVGMAAVPQADERHDPGKATIGEIAVIREVLDHAGSVDEAVAILNRYNIDWEGGPPLHYFVADRSGQAALVEFYDDEIAVLPAKSGWQAATNFVRSAVPGDAAGQCPRYDTLIRRLGSSNGVLAPSGALDLLQSVAQPTGSSTQWSAVYSLSQGQVEIVMGRQYGQVHTFRLAQPPGP